MFAINRSINTTFLTQTIASGFIMSPLSIILLSPGKSLLIWIRREICTRLSIVYKTKQSKRVMNKYAGGFWCERTTGNWFFSLEEVLLWIMDSHFSRKQRFRHLKTSWWICILHKFSFSLHKTLIDGLKLCGLLVDYCDVFIRCLDSHSDGTHSLQRIHRWASDVMLNFSESVLMKKLI